MWATLCESTLNTELCSFKLLESLNLVLVVGLAVDYVVHLAEGYSRSVYSDRRRRTQTALEEVRNIHVVCKYLRIYLISKITILP